MRVELALIGLRSLDLRGRNRNPRPASPESTTEVEACHPLLSYTQHFTMTPTRHLRTQNARQVVRRARTLPGIHQGDEAPVGAGGGLRRAHGGRPAWSGPVLCRASPEMRPGSHHDWAATPQAAPQSLRRTSLCGQKVAPRCQKAGNGRVTLSPGCPAGTGRRAARLRHSWT